jgi:hypothetical protein
MPHQSTSRDKGSNVLFSKVPQGLAWLQQQLRSLEHWILLLEVVVAAEILEASKGQ